MRTMKIAMAVVACALAAGTAQGRTVSANYTLAQDEDWTADGTVKIENSAMIDLNGHNLTVAGVSAYCITNETGVADGYSDLEYLDTSGSQRVLTNFKPADSDVVYMGVKFHEGSRATQMGPSPRPRSRRRTSGARGPKYAPASRRASRRSGGA